MICMKRHVLENSSRRVCRYLLILSSRPSVKREGDVLLFKSMGFSSFSLFHFRSRKNVVFSWVLPLSFCLSFSLRPPGGGTVGHTSHVWSACVLSCRVRGSGCYRNRKLVSISVLCVMLYWSISKIKPLCIMYSKCKSTVLNLLYVRCTMCCIMYCSTYGYMLLLCSTSE